MSNDEKLKQKANEYFESYVMEETIEDTEPTVDLKKIKMDRMEYINQVRAAHIAGYQQARAEVIEQVTNWIKPHQFRTNADYENFYTLLTKLSEESK